MSDAKKWGGFRARCFLTASVSALLWSASSGLAPAAAQQAQPAPQAAATQSADTIETVTVTAEKRAERLRDVPAAVSAISGEDLQLRALDDLQSYASQVPGLSVASDFPWTNVVILRGQYAGSDGAVVGTVVDDADFNQSTAFTGRGSHDTVYLGNYDLQRIEVLRGPQGTLYGANTEGGLIKYVTNAPDTENFTAGLAAGFDSVDQGGAGANVKGFINIPLVTDELAIRVVGFDENIPGYVDNPTLHQNDTNRGTKMGGRASVLFTPIKDLSIRYTFYDQSSRFDGDGIVEVAGAYSNLTQGGTAQFKVLNNGHYDGDSFAPTLNHGATVAQALTINYDAHWATLFSSTSDARFDNRYSNDASRPVSPFIFDPSAPPDVGDQYGVFLGTGPILIDYDEDYSYTKFNEEVRVASEPDSSLFGHGFDWQLGYYFTHESQQFNETFNVLSRAAGYNSSPILPGGGLVFPGTYTENSGFANTTFHFTDKIDLSLGGRYSTTSESFAEDDVPGLTNGFSSNAFSVHGMNEGHVTWSSALRWFIADNTMTYARFATGYAPGGPVLQPPGVGPNFPKTFTADTTLSKELGFRTLLDDKRINIDIALYDINWDKIQLTEQVPTNVGVFSVTGNGGTALSQGIEWNLSYTPMDDLTFKLTGATTNAHLTQLLPSVTGATIAGNKGDRLAYSPDVQTTFDLDYSWPVFGDYRAFAGGEVSYYGTRYTDFGDPTQGAHKQLPSYVTTGLQFGIREGRYMLEVYGHNLNNAQGITQYYPDNFGVTGTLGGVNLITPRTFGARASVDF